MAVKITHSSPAVRSMGIDPSTHTGLVLVDSQSGKAMTKALNFPDSKGMYRLELLRNSVQDTLLDWQPDIAVIEGYGYANKYTLALMVEIGVLIRMCLHTSNIPWYIAPPSVLKKYATGSGTAKKPQVAAAVKDRWGFTAPSDDVVDAYVLARLGCDLAVNGVSKDLKGVERG